MAVDGDPTTAWRVADRAPAEGHRIRLEVDEPIDHVTLRQPTGAGAVRHIGAVTDRRRRPRAGAGRAGRQLARRRRAAHRPRTDQRAVDGDHHHRLGGRPRPHARTGVRRGRVLGDRLRPRTHGRGGAGADRSHDGPCRAGRGRSAAVLRPDSPAHPPDGPLALRPRAGHGPRDRGAGDATVHTGGHRPARSAGRSTPCWPSCWASRARRPAARLIGRRRRGRVGGHRRRSGDGVDHALRPGRRRPLQATLEAPSTELTITQRTGGDTHRSPGCG